MDHAYDKKMGTPELKLEPQGSFTAYDLANSTLIYISWDFLEQQPIITLHIWKWITLVVLLYFDTMPKY